MQKIIVNPKKPFTVIITNDNPEDMGTPFMIPQAFSKQEPYLIVKQDKRYRGGKKYLQFIFTMFRKEEKPVWVSIDKIGQWAIWLSPFDHRLPILQVTYPKILRNKSKITYQKYKP